MNHYKTFRQFALLFPSFFLSSPAKLTRELHGQSQLKANQQHAR